RASSQGASALRDTADRAARRRLAGRECSSRQGAAPRPSARAARRDDGRDRGIHRGLRLDCAPPGAPRRESARMARLRGAAPLLDRRAVGGATRGRERRARRLSRSRDVTVTRAGTRRLAPDVFDLPVEKIRAGYYTDAYFNHARSALLA